MAPRIREPRPVSARCPLPVLMLLLTAFGFVLMLFGGWLIVAFATSAQQVSQARLVGMLTLGAACIILGGFAAWVGYHPSADVATYLGSTKQ